MSKNLPLIQQFILAQVSKHPSDLVRFTAEHFKVTVQAVQKHITQLIKRGELKKEGKTRSSIYLLASAAIATPPPQRNATEAHWAFPVAATLSEQDVWDSALKERLAQFPENIREIVEYGFTEMVNNVKDHAMATEVRINYKIIENALLITIQDNGVGIFRKLKDALSLETLREAILHLSKGKLTTDHTRHTGEGIFFSSRVFDKFFIYANELLYGRINTAADEDWLSGEAKTSTDGTIVTMEIALDSARTREEVFRKFTTPEDFSFSKTHVAVELGINAGETYVSRSQAKRILSGLEKFKFIVLNFKRVNSVGQGFVDEVFRIFKNTHPDIDITYINANDSVSFMIKRSLSN